MKGIKHAVLGFIGNMYYMFGLLPWVHRRFFKDPFHVRVLSYHDIQDKKIFEKHIVFLKENFRIIDPDTFANFFRGKQFMQNVNILVTFDDGSVDQYEAAEILDKHSVKGCFFITVDDVVGKRIRGRPGTALTPMNWEQIKDLHNRGHKIGSHSLTHPKFKDLQPVDIQRELKESKKIIEKNIGAKTDFFAFPLGTGADISDEAQLLAQKTYEFVFTFLSGANHFAKTSSFVVRRSGIDSDDSIGYLRALLLGVKDFLYKRELNRLDNLACH